MIPLKETDSVSVLRSRISDLRAKRGVALLEGESIERLTAEIATVTAQADALEDLESAESQRAYAETASRQKVSRSVRQKQLDHFTDRAVDAVRDAEIAMHSFVAAYRSMRSLYYAASQVKHEIDGKIPTTWNLTELNARMGFRVGALLSTIDSSSLQRLGPVSWHLHGSHGSDCSWVELETDILKRETK